MKHRLQLCAWSFLLIAANLWAGPQDFETGPVIKDYGRVAKSPSAAPLDREAIYRVAMDVAVAAESGQVNRQLDSAARFINMHVAAGLPRENIHVAIVVHGPAAIDLTRDATFGGTNASAGLIAALLEAGVTIQLCGQTAAHRDIDGDDLLPGVSITLSAMTAHAQLQQAGYTLNPF